MSNEQSSVDTGTFERTEADEESVIPTKIEFQDISAAAFRIRDGVERTACTKSNQLSSILGMQLYFKREFRQVTGSFKERGARNCLLKLSREQRAKGVVAASAGNHALALSYHGHLLGVPVSVVMPTVAPLMKISLCRSYGASVLVQGAHIAAIALRLGAEQNLIYVNGYDHPDVVAGQGTVALEILDQVKDIDAVVIPVGGGGLLAGMATVFKYLQPNVAVIGVETETCAGFAQSLAAGAVMVQSARSTLADGLAVPSVGRNALATAEGRVDRLVAVDERHVALAILRLVEVEKAVVEGAGAVGLAALLAGALPELAGKRVVLPLTGGNIDTTVLGRAIERGLAVDGRLIRVEVTVSDRPGGVAELTALIAGTGASIKDIFHERAWLASDVFSVKNRVVLETRDADHAAQVEAVLRAHYAEVECLH